MKIQNVADYFTTNFSRYTHSSHHVLEHSLIPDAGLCLLGYLGHGLDTDHRVVTLGGLPGLVRIYVKTNQ